MLFNKGDKVKHDSTGLRGTIESRGNYANTVIITLEPVKIGELPRQLEVYLKDLSKRTSFIQRVIIQLTRC